MSSVASTLWQTLCKHLYPTTTYHYNSGGDPEHIPELSYQQLKDFYKTHYHPSNAIFMTYGDIPAAEHQQTFEQQALARFDALDVNIHVPEEKRYSAPIRVQENYAFDEEGSIDNKHHLVMGGYGAKAQTSRIFCKDSYSPVCCWITVIHHCNVCWKPLSLQTLPRHCVDWKIRCEN